MADLIELMPFCWLLVIGFGLLVHLIISLRSVLPSFVRDVYEYGRPRRAESWFISVPKKYVSYYAYSEQSFAQNLCISLKFVIMH